MLKMQQDTKKEKTVLIIAYYYTPINNGGVERPVKFVRYLPLFKYSPVVITTQVLSVEQEELGVYRFRDRGEEIKARGNVRSVIFRGLWKILYKVGILWGYNQFWYKEALNKLNLDNMEHKPDIIMATFPPVETLMLGVAISKQYHIPLVLDFRDGMVFDSLSKEPFTVQKRIECTEKYLVQHASHIITATEPISNYFKERYPYCSVSTITNGFDPEECNNIKRLDLGKKINIVYTGRLSKSRQGISVEPLADAINCLTNEEKQQLSIWMVGDFTDEEIETLNTSGTSNIFNLVGFVNRESALQYQKSADILLLITGMGQRSVATGKLFEYLAAGKPILGLTAGTVAEEIITATGTGVCVSTNDVSGIVRQLKKIIRTYPNYDFYKPNELQISKYNRKELTAQLAEIFDQVLEQ